MTNRADVASTKKPRQSRRRGRVVRWTWRAFTWGSLAALVLAAALDRRYPLPTEVEVAILSLASLSLFLNCINQWERRRVRRVGRARGFDVCPACLSMRALQPDDQQCPSCDAPRACSVCGHRLEANQHACPECGRAVWGREP